MKNARNHARFAAALLCALLFFSPACDGDDDPAQSGDDDAASFPYLENGKYPFGYLLNGNEEALSRLADFNVAVVDLPAEEDPDLALGMQEAGTAVYSYVNLGSLEDWRDFSDEYWDLCLQTYQDWKDECWVDVRDARWQDHFVEDVCGGAADLGAAGFYIDNTDIYDLFPGEDFRDALLEIYRRLRDAFPDHAIVVQNGASLLTDADVGQEVRSLVDAVSFEDVSFTPDFDAPDGGLHTYVPRDPDEHQQALGTLDALSEGLKVYTVDYTEDASEMLEAVEISRDHGFTPFVGEVTLSRFDFYPKLP